MNNSEENVGYLIVKVSTAGEGIPVRNAGIYIKEFSKERNGETIYSLRTNEDGTTETVSLQAPPRTDSLSPGSTTPPYAQYVITARKEGFNAVENIGVPIFSGITSIQNVVMIPLTEDQILKGEIGEFDYFENNGYPALRNNS